VPALVGAVVVAATLSPWLIRERVVFHRWIPMRDSMGLELWMGNNGYTTRFTSDQIHPLHDAAELAAYDKGELAYMDHKAQQADAYIAAHQGWYAWMCVRRAVYLWTGYWSFSKEYLAMEPADLANIPFATSLTVVGLLGWWAAARRKPFEAMRYGGVLFLFPMVYYFAHPEPYHMRPLDPLLVMLACYGFLTLRKRADVQLPTATTEILVLPE